MNHPHAPIAWVDESGSNSQLDPGSYIMSAALVEPLHEHAARETMRPNSSCIGATRTRGDNTPSRP